MQAGLWYSEQDAGALAAHIACVEDTAALRAALPALGLVSFVGDGAVLPRKSGACDEPMAARDAVPFESPPSLAVSVDLPNRGRVRGLGVRTGVTLIVGGGFHGKSTLLQAIEAGVYNKVGGGVGGWVGWGWGNRRGGKPLCLPSSKLLQVQLTELKGVLGIDFG